ncbi:Pancreatic triacylglycerol lipase-like protein, partial [Dinothrombium tinctorium]
MNPYFQNVILCLYLMTKLQGNHATGVNIIDATPTTRCIHELGCFPITKDFIDPINRPINSLPSTRKEIDTQKLKNLFASNFEGNIPTKMIIPGYLDNLIFAPWLTQMKDALLAYEHCNVIIVEWTNITPYHIAAADSRVVGAEIANLILFLETHANTSRALFHLIGHSLGAHIAAYAGQRVRKISRITGLDPARPLFQNMPISVRLDPSDADFVDNIHTDTTGIFPFGFSIPNGHVDFFPNGPHLQPGCEDDKINRGFEALNNRGILQGIVQSLRFTFSCNHQRAYQFFIESIRNKHCTFVGVKCSSFADFLNGKCLCDDSPDSCAPMGISAADYFQFGIGTPEIKETYKWFLKTDRREPFC